MSQEAAAALRDAAAIGPYFEVALDPVDGDWTRLADAVVDRETISAAIERARTAIAARAQCPAAAVEQRAVASIWHLGVAARIVSPVLAVAADAGLCVDLAEALCRLRDGAATLAVRADRLPSARVDGPAAAASTIEAGIVRTLLEPLTTTVAAVGGVSRRVLWGNVWSAFVGAAGVLATHRPTAAATAEAIVGRIVAVGPDEAPGAATRGRFLQSGGYRRDTCCLYYRLRRNGPFSGLCGDCVLHDATSRSATG